MRSCSALLLLALASAPAQKLQVVRTPAGSLEVRKAGIADPLLVQNAPPDMRPYLHPLRAPDGAGVLTEFRPSHHHHQTGIFFGFSNVNGRSFFHNTGGDFFRGKGAKILRASGRRVVWSVATDWLAADGSVLLAETQRWTMEHFGSYCTLDLDWSGRAAVDLTFGKTDYGGLFIRMPWKPGIHGGAVNSEAQSRKDAEGQRARWVDVGMDIEGRSGQAHIAMLDHPSNPDHPVPWRVDANLGVVPSRGRLGDWRLAGGQTARARYRLLIYTGPLDKVLIEQVWKSW
ncbi:MAG: PmoA family protein [Acidobacteria bacterium]|nr:PmoA family protein [Acidobacteriota bacterium]